MLSAEDVIQLYEGWKSALANGSIKALEVICHTDFTRITSAGMLETRAEVLQRAGSGDTVYESWTSSGQRVRFYGNTAVLNCRDELKLLVEGRAMALEQRAMAVFFRKDDSAWQLVGTQSTDIATNIDAGSMDAE